MLPAQEFVAISPWRIGERRETIGSKRAARRSMRRHAAAYRAPARFVTQPEGEVSMSTHICSREARAAQRFVEATRNVDQAFRAVRGEGDDERASTEYAAAMSRLDRALDELARAQAFFDHVVSADAAQRN
nr:hypothetical protein [Burkholderia multivorans]